MSANPTSPSVDVEASGRENADAVPLGTQPAASRLRGHVDAVDGARLFGWAWDETRPDLRLAIRVTLAGRLIAETVADTARVDLRRNGIGDGAHAFDVLLSDEALADRANLVVTATSPATGETLVLAEPAAEGQALAAAVAVPMAPVLDRLELIQAAQRRLQLSQKELLDGIVRREESHEARRSELEESVRDIRRLHTETAERLAGLDVFLTRFDATLAGFDRRLDEMSKKADRPLKRAVVLLCALAAVAAASSVLTFATLLLRH